MADWINKPNTMTIPYDFLSGPSKPPIYYEENFEPHQHFLTEYTQHRNNATTLTTLTTPSTAAAAAAVAAVSNKKQNLHTNPSMPKKRTKKDGTLIKKKKGKKKKSDPSKWKSNISKQKRLCGETYFGKDGKERSSRKVGPRCESSFCKRSHKRNCDQFSEDERKKIFDYFWGLKNWDLKRMYTISLCERVTVKQPRSANPDSNPDGPNRRSIKRKCSVNYFLKPAGRRRLQVCKEFFCATLGMPFRTISEWLSTCDDIIDEREEPPPKQGKFYLIISWLVASNKLNYSFMFIILFCLYYKKF